MTTLRLKKKHSRPTALRLLRRIDLDIHNGSASAHIAGNCLASRETHREVVLLQDIADALRCAT